MPPPAGFWIRERYRIERSASPPEIFFITDLRMQEVNHFLTSVLEAHKGKEVYSPLFMFKKKTNSTNRANIHLKPNGTIQNVQDGNDLVYHQPPK